MAGERFGRYVLLEAIGRGGMAEVYRAVAQGLEGFQRVFVIKRILPDKCASPEFVEMFVNEARISALLSHPNIVQIYDFGQIDGAYFLAMEYLRGKDLLTVLRQLRAAGRALEPTLAAYAAQQVALGLDYAHHLTRGGKSLGIVHRDVSPSNIMLLRQGGVKLLDFGIAKAAMELRSDAHSEAGLVKGKLSYLSPEQVKGTMPVDGRSDVFALGIVLWESLTGKRLFFDRNDFQTMKNVLDRKVPAPSSQQAEVPAVLDHIVMRALEREPERRYPSAKAMADEIEVYLQEARFAPRAVMRLLDDLYGTDTPYVDLLPGAAGTMAAMTSVTKAHKPGKLADIGNARNPQSASSSPISPDVEEESYTSVSSVRRMQAAAVARRRRSPWLAAAAGVALAITGSAWIAGRVDSPSSVAQHEQAARPAPAPVAAAAPVVETASSATVSVKVESDPAGAEIRGEEGQLLGLTPAVLTLPRSMQPRALTIGKLGFVTRTQVIVPDREIAALLMLRSVDDRPLQTDRVRRRRRPVAPH